MHFHHQVFLAMALLSLTSCGGAHPSSASSGSLAGSTSTAASSSLSSSESFPDAISSDFSLLYAPNEQGANLASGIVLIQKTPSFSSKIASLSLFWGDENGPLADYNALGSFTDIKGSEWEFHFAPHALIPSPAKKLWVIAYGSSSQMISQASLDFTSAKKSEQLHYRFEVISDPQVSTNFPAFYQHTVSSFSQIKTLDPTSEGIVINGDLVDEAREENYDSFFSAFSEAYGAEKPRLMIGLGNHEFIDQSEEGSYAGLSESELTSRYEKRLALWEKQTGNTSPFFSTMIGKSYALFLGTTALPKAIGGYTRADCSLNDAELSWFKETLASAHKTGEPIYVFSHGPLRDTVSGSLSALRQTWYGYSEENEQKLREAMAPYPEILFFSSHTHWCFESVQPYLVQSDAPSYFNTGAIAYLWQGEGAGESYQKGSYDKGGAQGLFVEVYDDQIWIKGYQFETLDAATHYHFSPYQVVINLTKGDNA